MYELQTVWGWQPALYLFLGGMGAGAFAMAAVLHLRYGARAASVVRISAWAAVACLVVGLLCLITELTNPLRGMMLWQSFSNFSSWMTIGAWILVATLVVFGLFALLSLPPVERALSRGRGEAPAWGCAVKKVLAVAGAACGVGVAAYTGILLMSAPGVPFWDTALLPCLFTVSGLDTGVALVEIVAVARARRNGAPAEAFRLMARIVIALVIIEAAVLAGFVGAALSEGEGAAAFSAGLLASGSFAPVFWGAVVACGLALPLLASVLELAMHRRAGRSGGSASPKSSDAPAGGQTAEGGQLQPAAAPISPAGAAISVVGALGALAGGCVLRFLVVMAGAHADPIGDTVALVFADLLSRL